MDIVKLVSQFATPAVLGQIASMLGVSRGEVQKGLGAAVPGVLAGLLGSAKRPGATDALGSALTRATGDGGMGSLLDSDPQAAASTGSDLLGSILGSDALGKLTGALGSYAGMSKPAGTSLLGLAGSMALGALGGEAKEKGLDAQGVLGMLEGHKDEISGALPAGFASALSGAGLFGDLGKPAPPAAAAVPPRPAATTTTRVETPRPAPAPPPARSGRTRWLIWLIAALVILWLLWRFLGPQPEPVVETAPPPPETTTAEPAPPPAPEPAAEPAPEPTAPAAEPAPVPAAPAAEPAIEAAAPAAPANPLVVGGIDVGTQVQGALDNITSALGGITDAESAKAALPDLTEARDMLSGLDSTVSGLPDAGKTALNSMVSSALPAIRSSADKLLGDSAIAGVIKPVVDDILAKLSAFAG